ncbi:MAG: aromatic ring-hydroxylating dioxygenase subunit alpha [Candidatus Eisenbacteria bacterium]|nr:aromatic ring-hydroxylating dioxygenase subunit alpha [Candidatus Eisenbacteria bacterium]
MTSFPIESDIHRASTLPADFYTGADAWKSVRERVFTRAWQWVADIDQVRVPGQVWPFTLLEGLLDEPLVLTRDADDTLHAMSNVCTHRGAMVVEGAGVEKALRCRYHGRRFGLDGKFQYMPEFEGAEGFPSACDDLPQVGLGRWSRFLFASLAPLEPVESVLQPMIDRIGWLPVDEFRFDPTRSREYLVRAHWALYCDNYLEGLHIPYIHAGLNSVIDYGNYTVEIFERCNLQLALARPGDEAFDPPAESPDFGKRVAAYYWWLFPNMMFNFYPWGLSINIVRPQGPALTRIQFLTYVWREDKMDSGAGSGLDRVEREDESVVESVQRGLKSRLYRQGRFSPTRETGVHHFHTLLSRSLA